MSEPTLTLIFDDLEVTLTADQAMTVAEAVSSYLNTISDIREGKLVEIGDAQNFNWN